MPRRNRRAARHVHEGSQGLFDRLADELARKWHPHGTCRQCGQPDRWVTATKPLCQTCYHAPR